MTQEEKAKRYDEAIKVAADIKAGTATYITDGTPVIDAIFPELKESEDEKIKKELIKLLRNLFNNYTYFIKDPFYTECIAWLEKQGEQKTVDKVEPKFHEGDWAVSNLDGKARQISEVHFDEYNSYYIVNGKSVNLEEYDRLHHLWTINDAKAGDVLSDGTTVFIFKDLLSDGSVMSYCDYDADSGESDAFCPLSVNLMCSKITPATKEQRDTLMKAMIDAGYTFDFVKKELKKIEQNPAWSEEDEEILQGIWDEILANKHNAKEYEWKTYDKFLDWLKSLEDRVYPKPKWSEENESYLNTTIAYLKDAKEFKKTAENCINWLKSLRPRNQWKPSDEQMEALEHFIVYHNGSTNYAKDLEELRLQLKKLKGE